MEFKEFVRKPFTVEAVEITAENIEEISKFVGDLNKKEDGTPYIQVDRRKIPSGFRVYPGFWMTRMGDKIRCYSRRIFSEQFAEMTPEIKEWVDFVNKESQDNAESEVSDDSSNVQADAGII